MQKYTLFIADLHLQEQQTHTNDLFKKFLSQQTARAEALYILGDFFELWIGDDYLSPFYQNIFNELKKLSEHIPIYFMPGNRDFLVGKKFANQSGCQFIPDPYLINLYGTSILLMHGDVLCTLDKRHLVFRAITQSFLGKKLFLSLPLFLRKKIALHLRQKSIQHTQTALDHVMDVTDEAVAQYLKKYNVAHLIHGHTHRPDIHYFPLNNDQAERIVLGAWHEKGCALRWFANGERELVYF